MANIGQGTFDEINGAQTDADLSRIEAFLGTGDQDESNGAAREAIKRKRQEVQALSDLNNNQSALTQNAQDYYKNIPQTEEAQFGALQDNGRRQLAGQLQQTNSGANRRGLLYSGLNQGAQQSAVGQYAANLSQGRQQINAQTEQNAYGLQNQAVQSGLALQKQNQGAQDSLYQRALQRRQMSNDQKGQILGGLGYALGGAASGAINGGGGAAGAAALA